MKKRVKEQNGLINEQMEMIKKYKGYKDELEALKFKPEDKKHSEDRKKK
eukprot:CAMPEP_0116893770 /NCGR_PEP_ID=MMETSP0467-20121206/3697_1 /TAXON_ID=283647 /ORGANISM="Mesodinium pulex, Strain SPMC105" /LENGTH=48 /DNA_ID= /DNA_START= /DNA_END= /DNA_ORIENTATION=